VLVDLKLDVIGAEPIISKPGYRHVSIFIFHHLWPINHLAKLERMERVGKESKNRVFSRL